MRRLLLFLTATATLACSGTDPSQDLCKSLIAGDLVITEFLTDPNGTDTGSEWIEIYNTRGTSIDLKGVTLYTKKLDGTGAKSAVIRAGTVPSGSYFAMGDVRTGALPSYIGYSYEDALGSLSNGVGIIGLKCVSTVIDEIQYTVTPKAGHARQLDGNQTPDSVVNDDETKFCDADQPLAGTPNFGTPGVANTPCLPNVGPGNCLETSTGTARPIVPPLPGDVFFTEVMADPKAVADTDGEWLEVHAVNAVDLNGVVLGVSGSNHTLSSTACLHLTTGSYAILAKDTDAGINGGLPDVMATFTQSLGNSGGTLTLSIDDAGIDTAVYGAATSGVAWQLDPARLDAVSNDDPSSFCRATMSIGGIDGGDLGTPAAANTACPSMPTPGQCVDPISSAMRPVVKPTVGQLVITEFMADPSAVSDAVGEYIEVRANASVDLNGLVLGFDSSTSVVNGQTCLAVTAGTYSVFGTNTDSLVNGGLPPLAGTFSFSLTNSGTHTISVSNDAGMLDVLVYSADAGHPVTGASTQLSSAFTAPGDNDVAANLCSTSTASRYGSMADAGAGDRGTPGLPNETCP